MSQPQPENVYLPKIAIMDRVVEEIADVKTFYWHFEDPAEQAAFRKFLPGQFAQVSVFGAGEFPASLPPSPTEEELFFTVRRVGSVTAALHQLQPGDNFARAGPVRERLPDESVLRPEPGVRGRRHRPHPAALLPQLRPGQPGPLRKDPALLRGAQASRTSCTSARCANGR